VNIKDICLIHWKKKHTKNIDLGHPVRMLVEVNRSS